MNKRGLQSILMLILIVVYYGCGFSGLTREKAMSLIKDTQYYDNYRKIVRLIPEFKKTALKYKVLEKYGYWGNTRLSKTGKKLFKKVEQLSWGSSDFFGELQNKLDVDIEILGIADSNYGKVAKEAKFQWRYKNIPSDIKKYITTGGSGFAYFKKYDDGWKLEEIKHEYNQNPEILTKEDINNNEKELKNIEMQLKKIAMEKKLRNERKKLEKAKALERKRKERDRIEKLTIKSRKINSTIKKIITPEKNLNTEKEIIVLYNSAIDRAKFYYNQRKDKRSCFVDISNIKKDKAYYYNYPLIVITPRVGYGEFKMRFSSVQERDEFYVLLKETIKKWKKEYPELNSPEFD